MTTYEEALAAFESGKYGTALNKTIDMLQNDENTKDSNILMLKSLLRSTTIGDGIDGLKSAVSLMYKNIDSFEDAKEIQRAYDYELSDYFLRERIAILKYLEENPDYEIWKSTYSRTFHDAVELMDEQFDAFVSFRYRINDDFKATNEKYDNDPNNKLASKNLHDYEEINKKIVRGQALESALIAMEAVKDPDAGFVTDSEWLKTYSHKYLSMMVCCEMMLNQSYNEKDGDSPEEIAKTHKAFIKLYSDGLNVVLRRNTNPLSLLTGNSRVDFLGKLESHIDELKEIEPDYEAPEIGYEYKAVAAQTSSGGCYVATAVYGSYDCPEVWTLRRFRDFTLAKSFFGRLFIRTYYAVSPTLVKWFGETKWFKNLWKPTLDKMVARLNEKGVENTPYDDIVW